MEQIEINTHSRIELVDITALVEKVVAKSKVQTGICVIFCPHTTAGLTINENADPSVKRDIIKTLSLIVPQKADYQHQEGNADSHIKSSLFGSSISVIIEEAKLMLGTWQGIFFCESDGPRRRQVWVKVIKET
ncbi:MAG: secondary thiamine-phosphate synthase enzyme YjbQ [Candidatus Omnitrophica bacterium]|nr:secondary thiamine-phosphate synthase enzyme YjbQ [Candidatus Omnitrophota bacterium]